MRSIILTITAITATAAAHGSDATLDKSTVRSAVQKSVSWLEADMQTWRKQHGCAACHHGPMYLWSLHAARSQGYQVEQQPLVEMTNWLLTNDEARVFPQREKRNEQSISSADRTSAAMMGHRNLSQPTIYLTHALNVLPNQDPLKALGWRKVVKHLSQAQSEDGSFMGRDAWRPIFNSPQILTRFVVSGLQDAHGTLEDTAERHRLLTSARMYLASQPADMTQQGIVLQILCEPNVLKARSGSPSNALSSQIVRLTQLQQDNGGWSQTDDRDSDAFATGQALVALHRAGMTTSDPAIQRGIHFLISTQLADGTWTMTSRPNPENGKPADDLNPITYAATAWATIGLASHVSAQDGTE